MAEVKSVNHYKSLGNSIMVTPCGLTADQEVQGGIIIPEQHQSEDYFKVVGFGAKYDTDYDIKMDDIILVAGKGGDKVDLGTNEYWLFPTKIIAAKLVDDEVIPVNRHVTLIPEVVEEITQQGAVFGVKEQKENDVLTIDVIRAGDNCIDLKGGETVMISKENCIEIKTLKGRVYLTAEQAVLAIVED